MQWDGHNDVKMTPAKTFIVKCRIEPARHKMSQMNLTAVLKIVNDLANDTAAAVCGHRCIKVNFAMGAIGASERGRDSAFEGLGTLLAKWWDDTHGFCFALLAKVLAGLSLAAAESAYRRIQKRCSRLEQFKLAKRDHISATCALLSK
jgi:hypothetical protein